MQSDKQTVTPGQIAAFKRFLGLLPHGADMTLRILKAHLLIEEQVRRIIDDHLTKPEVLQDGRLSCHQAICLAEALCPLDEEPWIWEAVKNLNKIRNKIAHHTEPTGLDSQIANLIASFPSGLESEDQGEQFDLTIWSLFSVISSIEKHSNRTAPDLTDQMKKDE